MSVLARYFFVSISKAIFAVLLIILSLDALAMLLDEIPKIEAQYTLIQVFYFVALKLPASFSEYAGFAALIGVMVGLGAMANNSELTVIRASGGSLLYIGWLAMLPAIALIVCALLVSEFISPRLEHQGESQRSLLRQEQGQGDQQEGVWLRDGQSYIRINTVTPEGELYGAKRFLFDADSNLLQADSVNKTTYQAEQTRWLDRDIRQTEVSPISVESRSLDRATWVTDLKPDMLNMSAQSSAQMSIRNLKKYTEYLGTDIRRAREYQVSLWRKLLMPFSVASLVFLGLSFVLGSMRKVSVGERVFVGVVVAAIFQVAQDIFGPASVVWGFSAFYAVVIPITFTFLMAFGLLYKNK